MFVASLIKGMTFLGHFLIPLALTVQLCSQEFSSSIGSSF